MSNVLLCHICTYCSAFKASTWKARRSNQSILKEISPEYSLEGLMLKLKLQYFGHLMWIADSLEKTLMLGKTEGRRRRGWQRMRCLMASPTQWIWTPRDGEGQGSLPCCSPWDRKELYTTWRLNHKQQFICLLFHFYHVGPKKLFSFFLLHFTEKPEHTFWSAQYYEILEGRGDTCYLRLVPQSNMWLMGTGDENWNMRHKGES